MTATGGMQSELGGATRTISWFAATICLRNCSDTWISGGMAFLELMGRLPTDAEAVVFNACVVTLVEHGITPSALVARLTYLGAPEAIQGAVAAGLCGLGTVFVGTIEGSARYLQESLAGSGDEPDYDALAAEIVADHRARKAAIAGLGHPIHKPDDPRTPRLFAIAAEQGFRGKYVTLIERVRVHAERASGKVLPLNATGAIGALASELGIPWQISRGIGVMARAVGLVGHVLEEMRAPLASKVWHATEAAVATHAERRRSEGFGDVVIRS